MIELRCAPADGRPTLVRIGSGILGDGVLAAAGQRFPGRRTFVVADRSVSAATGCVGAAAGHAGATILVDGGEPLKSFGGVEDLLRRLVRAGADRSSVLVAVGGGSVGDAVGLAAALLLRGVELVLAPTTLLAMVDSSVGGKTAINLPEGKNLVGAYWPASEVWIDPGFLATLPENEWRSGLGEVLKVAIGLDAELFEHCERHAESLLARDVDATTTAITRSIAAKISVVESDPLETGPRRLLNLGHTLGHALEIASDFSIPHGIAVARGLHHAIDVATTAGKLAAADAQRIRKLLASFGFEPAPLTGRQALLQLVERDKKVVGGQLHAVLPTGIGSSATFRMTPAAFLSPR
ncbi:MAG: 3-dehydroquinate synthase [Planctomycetota bacterium]|nr:3-dehydroquinate synthase [Planctomycetota bacterium]